MSKASKKEAAYMRLEGQTVSNNWEAIEERKVRACLRGLDALELKHGFRAVRKATERFLGRAKK